MARTLMELASCIYGFAGIPQDARLTFQMLSELDNVDLSGLILDNRNNAHGIKPRRRDHAESHVPTASRFIAALSDQGRSMEVGLPLIQSLTRYCSSLISFTENYLGRNSSLFSVDPHVFADFIWSTVFGNSLPEDSRNRILDHTFYACGTTLSQLITSSLLPLPRMPIDTSGFDYFVAQKPIHVKIPQHTRLVVRYHDSIPLTHPHCTIYPRIAYESHVRALQKNVSDAIFVCNSDTTRNELTRLFPIIKDRAYTINCCVSDEYYPDNRTDIASIIEERLNYNLLLGSPRSVDSMDKLRQLVASKFHEEYFLVVGSLEPRKNYLSAISAWEQFRARTRNDIKLVIVTSAGWNNAKELDVIRSHSARGNIFVLGNVPIFQLRALYSAAIGTIAPSFAEGFNFTGIESMKCATPVLASDIDTHREIYADTALFFDPYSPKELGRLMEDLHAMPNVERSTLQQNCMQTASRYDKENIRPQWAKILC